MSAQEQFVAYLQDHPGFYLVAKSDLYVNILIFLEKEAMDLLSLGRMFPAIELEDLDLMVKSLISLKLAGVLKTDNKVIYYATDEAREFLRLYWNTKTGFSTV